MKDSIIILCGGGPAPGMNTVVFSVAKTFLSNGFRVIGLHEGYSGLFNKNPRYEDIDFLKAANRMREERGLPAIKIPSLARRGLMLAHRAERLRAEAENRE